MGTAIWSLLSTAPLRPGGILVPLETQPGVLDCAYQVFGRNYQAVGTATPYLTA
jgi:hypothetical protein